MKFRHATLLLVFLLLAMPTSALGANPFQRLAHRSFQGSSVVGAQGKHPIRQPADLDVSFRWVELNGYNNGTPTMYWNSGCKGHEYLLTVEHQRFRTREEITSEKRCTKRQQREEQWLERFFSSGPTWSLSRGRLVLTAGQRRIVLRGKWLLNP
jgi:hypothetical protein